MIGKVARNLGVFSRDFGLAAKDLRVIAIDM